MNNFDNTLQSLGKLLKKRRLELGLSQQQLAERISKLDRSKISDMENGKEDFLFSTLIKVCEALEISLKQLLDYNVEEHVPKK